MPHQKKCSICKEVKPFEVFSRCSANKDGRRSECKKCHVERNRAYKAADPVAFSRKRAQWRALNRDKQNERTAKWRKANPDKAKRATLAWRQRNADRARATSAIYRSKNKAACAARSNKWFQNNPAAKRAYEAGRRARKRNAGGSYSSKDVHYLYLIQSAKCIYCRRSLSSTYHIDHIIPLAKGGTNERNNIQLLCPSCNMRKHTKSHTDFLSEIMYSPPTHLLP